MKTKVISAMIPLLMVFYSFTEKMAVKVTTKTAEKVIVKTLSIGAGVLISKGSKGQTYLTKEDADLLYKPKSYVPYISVALISGVNYYWIDSTYYLEAPVYTWNMVQDKPDFKSICFDPVYTNIIGTPTIPTFAFGFINNNNEYSLDTTHIMTTSAASGAISTMSTSIDGKVSKTTTVTINGVAHALNTSSVTYAVPTVTNTNQLTNGSGFITGITSNMITSALTYTPANSTSIVTPTITGSGATSITGS